MPAKILVVEDEPDNIAIFQRLLSRKGYDILVADNKEDGIRMGTEEQPDLILMDIKMPDTTDGAKNDTAGLEAIRHLKSDRKRYGWRLVDAPPSKGWEYAYDQPHFIGTKRTGPDLARVGGKYSSEWHWSHYRNPRDLGEKFRHLPESKLQQASIMPSYDYMSDAQIEDLTAYTQTLGRNVNWRKDKDGQLLNDYEE